MVFDNPIRGIILVCVQKKLQVVRYVTTENMPLKNHNMFVKNTPTGLCPCANIAIDRFIDIRSLKEHVQSVVKDIILANFLDMALVILTEEF